LPGKSKILLSTFAIPQQEKKEKQWFRLRITGQNSGFDENDPPFIALAGGRLEAVD
jgi:hypothetical protein